MSRRWYWLGTIGGAFPYIRWLLIWSIGNYNYFYYCRGMGERGREMRRWDSIMILWAMGMGWELKLLNWIEWEMEVNCMASEVDGSGHCRSNDDQWCLLQFTMGKLKRSALRNCAQQLSRYGICTDLLYTMSKERVERRGLCSGPYWRHA